jgi:hypothetical protein
MPFEIVSEFAALDSATREGGDPGGRRTYTAQLAEERLAVLESRGALKLVLVPAAGVESPFTEQLDIPITDASLFQQSDPEDRILPTTLKGTLTYSGRTDKKPVSLEAGAEVGLPREGSLQLTRVGLDTASGGLAFSVRGRASALTTHGVDRRLTLLDGVLVNRYVAALAATAVILLQLVWLRRYWPARLG